MEENDKGCPMIRLGVSGWVFLLVTAYPGSPGQKPLNGCVCVLSGTTQVSQYQKGKTNQLVQHTHTHTHLTALFSATTWVSRYQKGKTNLDFTEARDNEWQWHQLGHMQVCISFQTDNHTSTPPLSYRPDALSATQPTASKHWRHN